MESLILVIEKKFLNCCKSNLGKIPVLARELQQNAIEWLQPYFSCHLQYNNCGSFKTQQINMLGLFLTAGDLAMQPSVFLLAQANAGKPVQFLGQIGCQHTCGVRL
jgi:hypothetical protein